MTPKYIDGLHKKEPDDTTSVLIPTEEIESLPQQTEAPLQKPEKQFSKPPRKKIKKLKLIFFVLIAFLIFAMSIYVSRFLFYKNTEGENVLDVLSRINIFKEISNLLTSGDKKLAGEEDDRINFLLLGMGGEGHSGPYLTDTIILASLKPSEKRISMVSLPRDMFVQTRDDGWQKINSLYALSIGEGEEKALNYTISTIEDNFGLPIHYYFVVDFNGFKNIIDYLGGIKVEVERSFTDSMYPLTIDPPSWEVVSFEEGWQKMDGDQALKFARSRHGSNGENSDFARAKRQQKIIMAVKDKIFSFETLIRPTRVSGLFTMMDNYFQTNLKTWEVMKLYDYVKDINDDEIINFVLDDSPNNYLYGEIMESGAYALLPKGGNFSLVQEMLENIFQTNDIVEEKTYVDVLNGTEISGLAYQNALVLESLGLNINRYDNAPTQDYQTSVIYDLSGGTKEKSLEIIKNQIGGYVTSDLPNFLQEDISVQKIESPEYHNPDFIIILGQDQSFE